MAFHRLAGAIRFMVQSGVMMMGALYIDGRVLGGERITQSMRSAGPVLILDIPGNTDGEVQESQSWCLSAQPYSRI